MGANQPPEQYEPKAIAWHLGNIWHGLTKPASYVQEPEDRRRARLLSSILLPLTLLLALITFIEIPLRLGAAFKPLQTPEFLTGVMTVVVIAIAYALSRTQYYTLGAGLTVGIFGMASLMTMLNRPTRLAGVPFFILALALLLASLLLSRRATVISSAVAIVGIILIPILSPEIAFPTIFQGLAFIIVLSALVVISATIRHQDLTETEHQLIERRQAEEIVRRLSHGIEAAGEAIIMTDLEGNIRYVNPAFTRLTGYGPEEVVGQNPRLLQSGRHSPEFYQQMWGVIRSGEVWTGELTNRRKAGAFYEAKLTIAPVFDQSGEAEGFVAIQSDITKRKETEAELKQHREYLEELVQERTTELSQANAQLQQEITERLQAEEQIKATLRDKEVLLKEVHHRVKNNLQIVISLLYLQSKDIKDDAILEKFADSQNRIRSMALVHESLSQAGGLNQINFAKYIQDLVTNVFRSFRGGSGGIISKVKAEEVLLSIDTAIPCGLIINELVSNALKYAFPEAGTGQKKEEVRVTFGLDEGKYVLTVGDNGIGLPEDFDFRNTRSLGLKLVQSLVQQLDGVLELHCQDGTEFKIVFTEPTSKTVANT